MSDGNPDREAAEVTPDSEKAAYRDDREAAAARVDALEGDLASAKKNLAALEGGEPKKGLRQEIVQPFIDLVHAPRALWGVNFSNLLEGMDYFGLLNYLGLYFRKQVFARENVLRHNKDFADIRAGWMVGAQTMGITLSQFFLGGRSDKLGLRASFFVSIGALLLGRAILAAGATMGLADGWGSPLHLVSMLGILVVVLGYGLFQPVSYSAVRAVTTETEATMAYAMLYAVMNLGGWLPTFFFVIRDRVGIAGSFWVFAGFTALGLLGTMALLSRRTVEQAVARASAGRSANAPNASASHAAAGKDQAGTFSLGAWLRRHPLADPKFSFFIFCLIPVQTLFAHNWLTLPFYVTRAYSGSWIGQKFEVATNINPLLIFFLCPIVAAVSYRAKVYNMMILGTAVMAAPAFILALGPTPVNLFAYLVIMTVGEAMWQPRFLQYAAEIAPEGRTGEYMGVAQIPWFLTKAITGLYSGWFLARFCPEQGPQHTETMWLIYGLIAISTTIMLFLAKGWVGKDFKTKAA
jgi:MFS family permease